MLIFTVVLRLLKSAWVRTPAVLQLPIGAENEFEGIVDLIEMKEHVWLGEELGAKWDVREIRDEHERSG